MSVDSVTVAVAVPTPLSKGFHYKLPPNWQGAPPQIGCRVIVPFGRQTLLGICIASEGEAPASAKLKHILEVLDDEAVIPQDILNLAHWASRYYQAPIGEVFHTLLPTLLKQASLPDMRITAYKVTSSGAVQPLETLKRSPLQQRVLALLQQHPAGCGLDALKECGTSWRQATAKLREHGWIEPTELHLITARQDGEIAAPQLNLEQQQTVEAIQAHQQHFRPILIEGVTGSGKTEIYLRILQSHLNNAGQILVLVPEIGLTPQLLSRFERRLDARIALLHSGLNDTERLQSWRLAASGKADIIIGTRSAVFTPLPRLSCIIIDEEHDNSFKQQDGFRYHARSVAIVRAKAANIPIIMGSATPSFESLNKGLAGDYLHLKMTQRAGNAKPPSIGLLDLRRRKVVEGISERLLEEMKQHLDQQGQILIFLNRRGFSPVLMCDGCGAICDCKRCDAHMTLHATHQRLRCHHCGAERPAPTQCDSCQSDELIPVGHGTERVEQLLQAQFPDHTVLRIDRDSTRRKGELAAHLQAIKAGQVDILIGTQMLAKGHHFPNVTLVAILEADRGLYGTDFRATEHMAQMIVQVAGRAGRAERPGHVLIQTRTPENPLLQQLISAGYSTFADSALTERQDLMLPPYSHLALLRAESPKQDAPAQFLRYINQQINAVSPEHIELWGPVVAPMEKRGGRYRWQLLIQSQSRAILQHFCAWLRLLLESDRKARKVRWSLDIDPVDML